MKRATKDAVLVQTRVPKDIADWMKWHAYQDRASVAGWLRRLLINEKRSRGRRRLG